MRIVIQRCRKASVTIGDVRKSEIGQGMMILLGIEDADTDEDVDWLCRKIVALRIFDDAEGVMNVPITEVADSGILVVSQFTLMARTKKGNRPSCMRSLCDICRSCLARRYRPESSGLICRWNLSTTVL